MREFIALIHKETGSDFGVLFPDFPGCVTAGPEFHLVLLGSRDLAERQGNGRD